MKRFYLIILSFLVLNFVKAQVFDNFTDGDFTSNPTWTPSSATDFTVISGQLKSANTTSNTSFCISTTNTLSSNCVWEFWVNLQFATSSANYVDAYLVANNPNLLSPTLSGYFVRIGNTSDDISLYKNTVGTQTILIDGLNSTVSSASSNLIKIKVTRTSANLFTLERDLSGSGNSYITEGSITDATFLGSSSFGFVVKQSSAGFFNKHLFDDISVSPIVLDVTAPTIISVTPTSSTSIDMLFNENIDLTSSQIANNYSVSSSIGSPTLAARDANNFNLVHLNISSPLTNGTYTITINGVQDLAGNAMANVSLSFTYFAFTTPSFKDIVINEIYADPAPLVNLTTSEFIELYNKSSTPFNLNGLKLTDKSSIATIGNYTLSPNNYVIICPIVDTAQFTALGYANKLGVTNFPSLNNASDTLYLKTASNVIVDSVNYFDSWYQDPVKKNGGWTLEQINPNKNITCSQYSNWIASNNSNGGTPGFINSVFSTAPDLIGPNISSLTIIDGTHISLCFNEAITLSQLTNNSHYNINNSIGTPSLALSSNNNFCAILSLNNSLINNVSYTLTVNGITDCDGNSIVTPTVSFTYIAFGTPNFKNIIINEIYADPSPLVNLTSSEFIELYNNSSTTFNLNGLKLTDKSSTATLGNYTLSPNNYVIICPIVDTAQFTALGYANKLGVTNFPSLNNVSDTLYLKTASNLIVDSVNYFDSWYQDAVKKNGGWTLEQINPNKNITCSQASNWIASNNANGGTPGFINSVFSTAPDITSPIINSVSVINNSHISICFSELISSSQLTNNVNYNISGGIGSPSLSIPSSNNMCVTLSLASILINATTYTVTISNISDCYGNVLSPNTIAFTFTADVIAPSIISNTVISNNQLDVLFSEPLEINSAQNILNYQVNNSIGNPTSALRDANNTSLLHLVFSTPFTSLLLNTLSVSGVKDTSLNAISTATTNFTYYLFSNANFKDIIINEIFADPLPIINLPTCDFIELYNKSTKTINLNGLKVTDTYTANGATLGFYALAPNSYVIICPQADTAQFTALGYRNKLGVGAFPSLNNAGDNIYLKNSIGLVIDSVNYLDTWYKDATKKNGGYTLELINPTVNVGCSEISNWIASNDVDGGTPGFINSVYSLAPDIIPPRLDTVFVIDPTHIKVCFNDVISTTQLTINSNYNISGGIGTPTLSSSTPNHMCAILSLTTSMINATIYTLQVSGITDCNGNSLSPNTIAFTYTADVIPPSIISNSVISNTQLDVLFSEPLEITSAQNISNYIVNNGIGNPINATRDALNKALIHLSFTTPFTNGTLNLLSVSNIKDTILNTLTNASTNFIYYAFSTVSYKDIIINEIFADPSPVINLTTCEFIELYNRSSTKTYNLSGLHIVDSYSATTGLIGNYVLQPNSYVILCPIADTAEFTALGYRNKIGISSFPSLNNSGDLVYLKTSNYITIDSVIYFDTWYKDAVKKGGGYTLELINPNLNTTCSPVNNWIGSNDADGGTPGFINSVYSTSQDIVGPKIISVNVIDSIHLSICFDDDVSSSQMNTISNYVIDGSIGSPTLASTINNSCVMLSLSNKLINATNYVITVAGVTDCNGNSINPNSFLFSYYKHQAYDVVINELMPDPDPAINLPNEEFVELKNKTQFNINLKKWSFSTSTSTKQLPDITIKPDSFIVLTGSGNANTFYNYGIVANEVINFPSLANTGTTLTLRDSNGVIIHTMTYSINWYQDNNKTDGGWSLEQIDANNPCGGANNWHASKSLNGGTPGKRNSIASFNTDNIAPQLDRISVLSVDTILLLFSESLDSIRLSNIVNYTFDNGLTTPTYVKAIGPDFKKILLKLSAPMQLGIIYNCTVHSGITDCVGNSLINSSAQFALPQLAEENDVVINEVLFDPNTYGVDFVELYNRSHKTINLKDLRIGSMDTISHVLKDTETLTSDGFLLFPESYLVISENGTSIKRNYLTTNPKGFIDIVNLPNMNTSNDVVTLTNSNNLVIDNFYYTNKMHFPLLVSTKGVSLERIDFNRPTNDRTNWNSAAEAVGFATPAYRNSQYLQADGGSGITIPNPLFSPDNDGYNDVLNITYKLDEPGKAANVYIYDNKGRQVRHLVRNEQLTTDGVISWNGINDDNEKAPIGIYVVYVELFNLSGKINKYKLSCTLAGKL